MSVISVWCDALITAQILSFSGNQFKLLEQPSAWISLHKSKKSIAKVILHNGERWLREYQGDKGMGHGWQKKTNRIKY